MLWGYIGKPYHLSEDSTVEISHESHPQEQDGHVICASHSAWTKKGPAVAGVRSYPQRGSSWCSQSYGFRGSKLTCLTNRQTPKTPVPHRMAAVLFHCSGQRLKACRGKGLVKPLLKKHTCTCHDSIRLVPSQAPYFSHGLLRHKKWAEHIMLHPTHRGTAFFF